MFRFTLFRSIGLQIATSPSTPHPPVQQLYADANLLNRHGSHMKHFSVVAFLLIVVLGACGPNPSANGQVNMTETAPTPRPDPNDASEIQRRFVKVINEAIKNAEACLKKPVTTELSDKKLHTFFIEYTGNLTYDIKKTDSIVTPYLGICELGHPLVYGWR